MAYEEAPMDMAPEAQGQPAAPSKEEGKEGGEVCFTPPKGFKAPETGKKEWDMVCTFCTKPDGSVCLTKLGDTPMPHDEDKEQEKDSPEKPSYAAYAKPIMSAIGGGGEQQ